MASLNIQIYPFSETGAVFIYTYIYARVHMYTHACAHRQNLPTTGKSDTAWSDTKQTGHSEACGK